MKAIRITDVIGSNFENEDAILLRDCLEDNFNDEVLLDFAGINKISTTFLYSLFTNLINKFGRSYVVSHIRVQNLPNINDFTRVILGTAFIEDSMTKAFIN